MNSPHPELEALAELADPAAIDTPPSDSHAKLLEHVAGCPICTGDLEALRNVRETLRALPPVPMPPDLAERLEAALLAARTEDRTVVPLGRASAARAGRGRFQSLPLGAAAAVLVVLALGTAAVIGIGRSGDSKKSATSGAAVPAPSAAAAAGGLSPNTPLLTSGTRYTSADLRSQITAVITSAVPGAAQHFDALRNPDFAAGSSAAAAAPAFSAPAAATSAAPTASAPAASSAPAPAAPLVSGANGPARTARSGPLADPAALANCVRILAGKDQAPVLVDYATFNGVASTIIVLADPDVAGKLDVYVEADTTNCANQEVTYATFLDPAASPSP